MVNKLLKTICEPILYRIIRLRDKSWRTYHLLNTFILRPDLALLVRHLEIDLLYCDVKDRPQQSSFPWALEALSLLKNIKSLGFSGNKASLWSSRMEQFRIIVSAMGLTSLSVGEVQGVRWGLPRALVAGQTLVEFLRLQPQLEVLGIDHFSFPPDFHPQPSDLPNLRTLRATGPIAAKLISSTPLLRTLEIRKGDCDPDPFDFSTFVSSAAAVGPSISELVLHLPHPQQWASRNVASVFAVFSNIEKLAVEVAAEDGRELNSPDSFFDPQLEVRRDDSFALYDIRDFREAYMIKCKSVCPQLTTFIDLSRRIWKYQTLSGNQGGSEIHLVDQLLPERVSPLIDLPMPARSRPPPSPPNATCNR
ncbi:hypothetical protein FRC04_011853 [Tulasnella sp. 424]|nr:hypothetical protein FRC04_011853 [Tulasnella sp. 424]